MNSSYPIYLVAIAAVTAIAILNRILRYRKLREFSTQHHCEKTTYETRFQHDYLGLGKAVELGFAFRRKQSLSYTNKLFLQHGHTYGTKILGLKLVFTCHAQNIKQVLSTGFVDYDSSQLRGHLFDCVAPSSIFAVDGPEWKSVRGLWQRQLSKHGQICDLPMYERHLQNFIQHVPTDGDAFDIQALFFNLCADITSSFALGESLDALCHMQSPEKKRFAEDLVYIKHTIAKNGFRGPLHWIFGKKQFVDACARARRYVMAYAEHALDVTATNTTMEQESPMDVKDISQLTDHAMTLMIAAVDSVTSLLSATIFLLSQNRRVFRKLRNSIIDAIGYDCPTYKQLRGLKYMRWLISAALRLFPPAPFNARTASKDTVLPCGGGSRGDLPVLVERGSIVVFSTWASHRLGADFEDSPQDFIPERWELLDREIPGFLPFSKGPRICPGQQYAMTEASYVVCRILQTFSTITDYNTEGWSERIVLTLENDNGVVVGLRKESE
ncbi:cytochrome P450 [Aspergillus caelatus]|uniref:Cytochrome P450 n=1 Tax=Aspergillus caelatus TaxID=61420 RepID=A0A5N6ZJS3_9EURO|nr:cytochrome P450 [Aspergillus caelatus]KAE8357877.1 cytochrome P450 [Aspergillus caelatus]